MIRHQRGAFHIVSWRWICVLYKSEPDHLGIGSDWVLCSWSWRKNELLFLLQKNCHCGDGDLGNNTVLVYVCVGNVKGRFVTDISLIN